MTPRSWILLAGFWGVQVFAQSGPATQNPTLGMRIGGERDGPLGTFVAPWQEPVDALPPVRLQAQQLLSDAGNRAPLMDDSINRQFRAPEAVARPAENKPATQPVRRRGKKDDTPTVNIMQHDKQ